MKLTIEDDEGLVVTIVYNKVRGLSEVVKEVVRPALIGVGYAPEIVDHILKGGAEDED